MSDERTPEMMNRFIDALGDAEATEEPVAAADAPAGPEVDASASEPAPEAEAAQRETLSASEKAKYAQALASIEKRDGELARLKKELDTLKAQPKQKLTKEEFEALATKYANGRWDESDEPALTPEQQKIKDLEEFKARVEAKEAEAAQQARYEESLSAIKSYLPEESALSGMEWVPAKVYALCEEAAARGEEPDPAKIVKEYEEGFLKDVRGLLGMDRMRKALLSDPALRAQIAAELAAETTQQAQQEKPKGSDPKRNGPPVITRRQAAEVPARTVKAVTDEDLRKNALNKLVSSLD
jgi:hypothetical protein